MATTMFREGKEKSFRRQHDHFPEEHNRELLQLRLIKRKSTV